MLKSILTIAVSLVLCVLSFSSLQAQQPVGYVEKLDGPGNAFQLLRNEGTVPLAVLTPLYVGDQIKILPEKCKHDKTFQDTCTVTFISCNRQHVTIASAQSPYIISQDAACQTSS